MKKKKDYYLILGVSRSASAERIKAAYRRLAKKYHPDKTGQEGTRSFQDLAEAYRVLSDPEARAEYTESLRRSEHSGPGGMHRFQKRASGPDLRSGEDLREGPFNENPPFSTIQDVLLDLFQTETHTRSPAGGLELDLILSPEEARKGGVFPARIPLRHSCYRCGATGRAGFLPCPECGGTGFLSQTTQIRIFVPPGAGDGEVLRTNIPVQQTYLAVLIRLRIDKNS